jgi:SAM-dependent methyltransferase
VARRLARCGHPGAVSDDNGGYGPTTYGDAFADVYDDWYGEISDADELADRVAQLADGGSVLELGIGSGRLALPLVARGVEVWGIDASEPMVELMRAKPGGASIPVAIGDMADVDLTSLEGGADARFAIVLVAYNSLFLLPSAAAQQRCMEHAVQHLAPGGRVVIEAFVPGMYPEASAVEARTVEVDRVVLNVSRRLPTGAVHGQLVEITEAGIRLRPWLLRPCSPADLDTLAANVGLELEARWSGWDATPFADGDASHVSLYSAR